MASFSSGLSLLMISPLLVEESPETIDGLLSEPVVLLAELLEARFVGATNSGLGLNGTVPKNSVSGL